MKYKIIAFSVSLAFTFDIAPAISASQIKSVVVTKSTEHKLHEMYGFGGDKICVWATNLHTGLPSKVHVRRSLNGHSKDLDWHDNRYCAFSKPGAYVVYASGNEDLTVYYEVWGNVFDGPPRRPGQREIN
jgi:hypothetical protein